jgi:hypothetical protein
MQIRSLCVVLGFALLLSHCGQASKKSQEAPLSEPAPSGEVNNEEAPTSPSIENSNEAQPQTSEESSESSEKTETSEVPAEAPKEKTCEQRWQDHVALNTVGKFTHHRSQVDKVFGGRPSRSESETEQKIVSSDDSAVETEIVSKIGGQSFTSRSKMTKQQFTDACNQSPGNATQPESGTEAGVVVPAGKFDTRWVIVKSSTAAAELETKTWFYDAANGDTILVKSLSSMKMAAGEQTTEMVLVSTNR